MGSPFLAFGVIVWAKMGANMACKRSNIGFCDDVSNCGFSAIFVHFVGF
jgi:hypothetical protein